MLRTTDNSLESFEIIIDMGGHAQCRQNPVCNRGGWDMVSDNPYLLLLDWGLADVEPVTSGHGLLGAD